MNSKCLEDFYQGRVRRVNATSFGTKAIRRPELRRVHGWKDRRHETNAYGNRRRHHELERVHRHRQPGDEVNLGVEREA